MFSLVRGFESEQFAGDLEAEMEAVDRDALAQLGLVCVDEVDVLSGHATHYLVGAGDVVERVGELDEVVDLFLGQFRHWMFSFL